MNTDFPIDIVLPWVDGSDPAWIAECNKYAPKDSRIADTRAERFRDYGTLKYAFRGIEQFAPWVRTVHFVTCGQKPDWLNLDSPKLHWVKHSDYIPAEYLPVFSANPIELMMHKISGLAEHFIYFNDDLFLLSPIKKNYYFKHGLPCDSASFTVIGVGENKCRIPHILLNDMIEINNHFTKKGILAKNRAKWFSLKCGKHLIKNMFMVPWDSISCITGRHHAVPYLKSTLEKVWQNCTDALEQTMHNRFRNRLEDVNQWLFRFWQLCEGNFVPTNHDRDERMIKLSEWTEAISKKVLSHAYTEICIDDNTNEAVFDYEEKICLVIDMFEHLLPEKSSFEK